MIKHYLKAKDYLSAKEEKEVIKLCKQNNDEAKEQIVLSNIKYIYSEAKKLSNNVIPIEDLVIAGVCGLLCAAMKFDLSRPNRFITFATFWIRKEMLDYVYSQSSMLKVSNKKIRLAAKLRKKCSELSNMIDSNSILDSAAEICNCSKEEAKEILAITTNPASIDSSTSKNEDCSILDFTESNLPSPEEEYLKKEEKTQLINGIKKLNPVEQDVLIRHYGLFNYPVHTFDEIAKIQNKTRARIHQIEKSAKEKLYKSLA